MQLVVIDLTSFTKLLEELHVCHQDSKSKLSKISTIKEANGITFDCCSLKFPVDKLQLITTEVHDKEGDTSHFNNDLQYEEVLFIDDGEIESKPLKDANFEGIFVNIEDVSNKSEENTTMQIKVPNTFSENDPLLVERLPSSENISSFQEKISSNVFKVSAKNFIPKVVDWSSGSIENISTTEPAKTKVKYPSVLICEFCGVQFNGKDRIYKFFHHRNQHHTQEVKYSCPFCPKLYWGERELSAHLLTHLGKEHTCEFCGINFQRKSDLIRHFLVHKEKKFSCQYCSKMFRRKDHLNIHERIHTKHNPYICSKCDRSYPRKHQLNLHEAKCKMLCSEDSEF